MQPPHKARLISPKGLFVSCWMRSKSVDPTELMYAKRNDANNFKNNCYGT